MKKSLLFAIVFCSATWVLAQSNTGSSSSSSTQNGSNSNSAAQQSGSSSGNSNSNAQSGDIKIRGCVRQGNGDYEITDLETGTSYSLVSRGNMNIGDHVNRDVEVTGFPASTSGQTATAQGNSKKLGQNASDNPLQVDAIRDVGECSNSNQK